MRTQIVYEDKEILVIYKPEGFPAQSARVTQPDVVSELSGYLQRSGADRQPYVGLVHRLDQPVEGLMVVAKTKGAAAELSRQITSKEMKKTYLAVVFAPKNLQKTELTTLTDYMYKDSKEQKAVIIDAKEQKATFKISKAVLHYCTICEGCDNTALMEIRLETGRFHQIRAQMSHAGMPLLGDIKYGTKQSQELSKEKQVKETALCAYKLSFLHPKTKKNMEFKMEPHKPVFNSYEF